MFHVSPVIERREKNGIPGHVNIMTHPRSIAVGKLQNPEMSVRKEVF